CALLSVGARRDPHRTAAAARLRPGAHAEVSVAARLWRARPHRRARDAPAAVGELQRQRPAVGVALLFARPARLRVARFRGLPARNRRDGVAARARLPAQGAGGAAAGVTRYHRPLSPPRPSTLAQMLRSLRIAHTSDVHLHDGDDAAPIRAAFT